MGAGERPALEGAFGGTRLSTVRAATLESWSPRWRFDRAVRLAVPPLAGRYSRRAVVFLGSGRLDPDGLRRVLPLPGRPLPGQQRRRLLRRALLARPGPGAVLPGRRDRRGRAASTSAPAASSRCAEAESRRAYTLYTLRYRSRADSDFGRRYLDVQVEATLAPQERPGRERLLRASVGLRPRAACALGTAVPALRRLLLREEPHPPRPGGRFRPGPAATWTNRPASAGCTTCASGPAPSAGG